MLAKWLFVAASVVSTVRAIPYYMGRDGKPNLFCTFDKDQDGLISYDEFFVVGRELHQNKSLSAIAELWEHEDTDNSNFIEYDEFRGPRSLPRFEEIFAALDHNENLQLDFVEYARLGGLFENKSPLTVQRQWNVCRAGGAPELSLSDFTSCEATLHDVSFTQLHQLRQAKFAAFLNVARDDSSTSNVSALAEIDAAMAAAARMIQSGKLSFHSDPNFTVTFSPSADSDVQVTVPIVLHLTGLYTKFLLHSIRQLLLVCLRAGASPTYNTPWTIYRAPPLLVTLFRMRTDTALIRAMLDAGHGTGALLSEPWTGLSLLHVCFETTEVNIVKKLFVVADQFAISEELDHDRKSVADIFRDVAAEGVGTSGWRGDWQGDFFRVEFQALMQSSPTFADLVADWDAHGPTDFIDRKVSHAIGEENSMAAMRILINGGLDLTELAVQQLTDGWNILHLLAHYHYPQAITLLFKEVEFQTRFTVDGAPQRPQRRAAILRAAHRAMWQTDSTLQRTPAHFAAALHADAGPLAALDAALEMVERLSAQYGVQLTGAPPGSVPSLRDVLGNTPRSYADGVATAHIPTDSMPPEFFMKGKMQNTPADYGIAIDDDDDDGGSGGGPSLMLSVAATAVVVAEDDVPMHDIGARATSVVTVLPSIVVSLGSAALGPAGSSAMVEVSPVRVRLDHPDDDDPAGGLLLPPSPPRCVACSREAARTMVNLCLTSADSSSSATVMSRGGSVGGARSAQSTAFAPPVDLRCLPVVLRTFFPGSVCTGEPTPRVRDKGGFVFRRMYHDEAECEVLGGRQTAAGGTTTTAWRRLAQLLGGLRRHLPAGISVHVNPGNNNSIDGGSGGGSNGNQPSALDATESLVDRMFHECVILLKQQQRQPQRRRRRQQHGGGSSGGVEWGNGGGESRRGRTAATVHDVLRSQVLTDAAAIVQMMT